MPTHSRVSGVPAVVFALLLALSSAAGGATPQSLDEVNDYLAASFAADEPGVAVIVTQDGQLVLQESIGLANLEWDIPITSDTVFRIGSITKQFTAAGILLLQERGELSVADPITKFLPDYPTQGHEITLEHLLTHTSGIKSYTNIEGYMSGNAIRGDLTTDELIEVFANAPMEFAPGTAWNYNNSGYVLLGAVIEKVSGESYADFIKSQITLPLGLAHTHFEDSTLVAKRAAGYHLADEGAFINASYLSMTQPFAAGSLISTVGDLAKWNDALVNGRLISKKSYADMTRAFRLADGELFPYGFGLVIDKLRGQDAITHSGGIHGFQAYGLWHPAKRIYVAVLSNANGLSPGPVTVGNIIAAAAIGDPYPERSALPLDREAMLRYVGRYVGDDAPTVMISIVDGVLQLEYGDLALYDLKAADRDTFFVDDSLLNITVQWDGDSVSGLSLGNSEVEPPTVVKRVAEE